METRTMQPLKLEDLNAQFDSILRRYRDGGLIAYRDVGYFMNDMLNLFERIERLRLFVNNDGAMNILAVAVQESPRHERRAGKNLVSSAVRNFRTTATEPSVKFSCPSCQNPNIIYISAAVPNSAGSERHLMIIKCFSFFQRSHYV